MSRTTTLILLAIAALLEAGADAIVRTGLGSGTPWMRMAWFVLGALLLFAYAYLLNAPSWDFSKLMGFYVVFFFIAGQLVSWLALGQLPSKTVLLGGLLIVSGGVVIAAFAS